MMLCQVFLSLANLPASAREVKLMVETSDLMQSVHLFAGLPLGRFSNRLASKRIFGYLVAGIL